MTVEKTEAPVRASSRIDRAFSPIPECRSVGVWIAVLVMVGVSAAIAVQTPSIHAFKWYSFWNALAIMMAIGGAVIVMVFGFTRDLDRSVRYATAATVTVFWWTVFTQIALLVGAGRLPGILTVAVGAVFAFGIATYGRMRVVAILLPLIVAGVLGANVNQVMGASSLPQERGSIVTAIDPPADLPNVFVLLLDGYARQDTLSSLYSSDSDSLARSLAGSGFEINEAAVSNYNRTYGSVSSMLGLDTLVTADGDLDDDLATLRSVNGGDGEFLNSFSDAGYSVTFVPARWGGSRCGDAVDRCVRIGETQSSLFWLLKSSLLAPVAQRLFQHPWTYASLGQLRSIAEIYRDDLVDTKPTMTWMHVILPHPPVALTRSCAVGTGSWRQELDLTRGDDDDDKRKAAFVEQTACVNTLVVEQIRDIVESDPEAVILIVSDHGPDGQLQTVTAIEDYTSAQIAEKLSVLSAFRGPDRCSSVLEADAVLMGMRALTRCLLNAQASAESTGTYLIPDEGGALDGVQPVRVSEVDIP